METNCREIKLSPGSRKHFFRCTKCLMMHILVVYQSSLKTTILDRVLRTYDKDFIVGIKNFYQQAKRLPRVRFDLMIPRIV